MKQCIAEVLETQSEIIQLQRNVIDRLAATLLQHGMIEEEELAMMQPGGRPAERHRRMKPVKRIDRRAGPGRFFYFAENGAERNTKKWTI